MPKIGIIGAGFSGLSAAAYLGREGHEVHIFEQNGQPGGRARQFRTPHGYAFDMGPSWYWMPDVFENFFRDFGLEQKDFYTLKLLDPGFEMVFAEKYILSVPKNLTALKEIFESIEPGSAAKLDKFLLDAKYKYDVGMASLENMPGHSLLEFLNTDMIRGAMKLQVFSSFSKEVRKYFVDPKLIALMEFPVLFLGAMPRDTPALYSLMNYAGLSLGTWYPLGGFGKVIDAMVKLARMQGVTIHYNSRVGRIETEDDKIRGLLVNNQYHDFDAIIASADYHHVEKELLPEGKRNYTGRYWNSKTLAPSSLIYYIGINKKIKRIAHHTLFFETDLNQHARQIYKNPSWPDNPLFYVCCPSKSDSQVAPEGHENLFLLMPLAPGLEEGEGLREKYFKIMITRLEDHIGENISNHIEYKKSYCISDFVKDYNSYKGNAYGLANTLMQTAAFKPKIRNKKLSNLFYTGQLTVPGPGVPPALISGKIVARELNKKLKSRKNEKSVR